MRVLVIGANGMLGTDLCAEIQARGHEVVVADLPDFDITDPARVTETLLGPTSYEACVNCAAYTAVDAAETDVETATAVNTLGPGYLARACATAGTRLIHISTDYVFSGLHATPYTEEDRPNPLGIYGRTKLEGEESVLSGNPNATILRTSWLFGRAGKCFPKSILKAAREGKTLRVVNDQIGTPTYTKDLARAIVDILEKQIPGGLYHAAGPDVLSWFDFARLILDACPDLKDTPIGPILTDDWYTPAKRPPYSALATKRLDELCITPMRPISEAVADFCHRL